MSSIGLHLSFIWASAELQLSSIKPELNLRWAAVGAHSIIEGNKITVEAELFSLDGSKRYYEKKTGKFEDFSRIGKEVGQILKTKSNNSYKR